MSSFQQRTAVMQQAAQKSGARLLIAIPFYKNEGLVERVVRSLLECRDDLVALDAEVALYDDSPDYPALGQALARALTLVSDAFPVRVCANPRNLGFVGTMNQAFEEAAERRLDLLILNSDTVVTPGALTEMAAVAATDPMIAVVCPRSNNATLCTFPWTDRTARMGPREARAAHGALSRLLPRVTYAPTGVGFCMLIKHKVIAEFGAFDPAYGAGYNEENDFVMRANRCGYRAVLANHAFVWHEGEQSFAVSDVPRELHDRKNAAILDARYPEYRRLVGEHFASPHHQAERLISQLLSDVVGRLDVAFDLSGFGPFHNGTHEAGVQLLREAARSWGDRFTLSVLCTPAVWSFHRLEEIPGLRRCEPDGDSLHAVMVRMGQPFDYPSVERAFRRAPVQAVFMLDAIALDCGYLASQHLASVWSFVLRRCDVLATNSAYSLQQFERRFVIPPVVIRTPTLHSIDPAEYRRTPPGPPLAQPGYVFVVGNHYAHKHLGPTVTAILSEQPHVRVVALGAASKDDAARLRSEWAPSLPDEDRLLVVPAGELSEPDMASLFAHSAIVVFPSHYEGFGFPVMHGLAWEKPVLARAMPVYEEIRAGALGGENIHLFDATADLVAALKDPPSWAPPAQPKAPSGWSRSARELRDAIEQALERVSYIRLLERLDGLALIRGLNAPPAGIAAKTYAPGPELAAHLSAERLEWVLLRLYRRPMFYATARLAWRTLRPIWRALLGAYRSLRQ